MSTKRIILGFLVNTFDPKLQAFEKATRQASVNEGRITLLSCLAWLLTPSSGILPLNFSIHRHMGSNNTSVIKFYRT